MRLCMRAKHICGCARLMRRTLGVCGGALHRRTYRRTRAQARGASYRLRALGRDWGYPDARAKTLAECVTPWTRARVRAFSSVHTSARVCKLASAMPRIRTAGTYGPRRPRCNARCTAQPTAHMSYGRATHGPSPAGHMHADARHAHLLLQPVWTRARLVCHRPGTCSPPPTPPPPSPLPTPPPPLDLAVRRASCSPTPCCSSDPCLCFHSTRYAL
jgi:hypothetical protein